jgi:hypothetical protein
LRPPLGWRTLGLMSEVPWFLWWDGVRISEEELREKLRSPDAAVRGAWAGRILREARFDDVWKFLSVAEIVRDWEPISRNLGRERARWTSLFEGWRRDGLIS